MKTRRIEEQDLDELDIWYRAHGWENLIPDDLLPKRGFIVEDYAALWLYVDDSKAIAWVAFMVTNPRKNPAVAFKALHLLYDRVDREAEGLGIRHLIQTVSHSSLKKLAEQHNYMLGDKDLVSFAKKVTCPQQ
jgi:hypothetical protein